MTWKIEVVSEPDWHDYEVWTCTNCGRVVIMNGTGGDLACCPCEFQEPEQEEDKNDKSKEDKSI